MQKNMHNVEIQTADERMQEMKQRIRGILLDLTELNEADGDVGEVCTALAALHSEWGRKHVLMKQMGGRVNLDKYAAQGG